MNDAVNAATLDGMLTRYSTVEPGRLAPDAPGGALVNTFLLRLGHCRLPRFAPYRILSAA